MSFFSEERSSELKELFFETASELLQTLNEEGLKLEQRPGDAEIIRGLRRTVHTLKGDSAACSFEELSAVAHELEDVLAPEIAAKSNNRLAEIVLQAADLFASMLSAYREGAPPPSPASLREQVRQLVAHPEPEHIAPYKLTGRFAWTECEQEAIEQARNQGTPIYNIALAVDPVCPMKAAAMQLVKNALIQLGEVLAIFPDSSIPSEQLDVMEFAIASTQPAETFDKRCRIPSVISDVSIESLTSIDAVSTEPRVDDLGDVLGLDQRSDLATAEMVGSQSSTTKLRVDAERIDAVLNLVGELVIGKSMLTQTVGEFDKRFKKDALRNKFADAMSFQARVLNDLQKSVMKIRMVPVEQLFRRFPRVVRDVSKACGKEVTLQIQGAETDLDKSILDLLAEPLTHLVRNCVDHGIETSEQRLAAGKPPSGTLRLNAYHQGNQILIECSDDGAGIDRYKLVSKAVEKGLLTTDEAEHLSDDEALRLIFHPGLSTADQVTEISGRGVGMDVVQNVIEQLKGAISIDSTAGVGTTFLLKVPLTLAIIKALMFRVAGRIYAVPLASVLEIARISGSQVHRVNQFEVMQLRDEVLTLVRMAQLMSRDPTPATAKVFVVVVSVSDRKYGLVVDRLVGEEELVIKALDDYLITTELVSGASILGDGSVVLILNLSAIIARLGKPPVLKEAVTA